MEKDFILAKNVKPNQIIKIWCGLQKIRAVERIKNNVNRIKLILTSTVLEVEEDDFLLVQK